MSQINMRGPLPAVAAWWALRQQARLLRQFESISPDALEGIDEDTRDALLHAAKYAVKVTDRLLVHVHRPWARNRMRAHLNRFVTVKRDIERYALTARGVRAS